MVIDFGFGDYERVEFTGNYAAAHTSFYASKFGNPVDVFYPMDKSEEQAALHLNGRNACKLYCDFKDNEAKFRAFNNGLAWLTDSPPRSTTYDQLKKKIRTKAISGGKLAEKFASGKEQLIPLIFSHGWLGGRQPNQTLAQEFARNGYIVFIPDHLDGSACYVELEDGSVQLLNKNSAVPSKKLFEKPDNPDCQYWYGTATRRAEEISEIITDILDPKFMRKTLNLNHDKA